jgi:superfamily II DNA or RNA helicase
MYSLILPELIVDVFKETGNKNIIKHFLDEKKTVEFEEFETQRNYITINYQEERYCLTKNKDDYNDQCEYIILVNKKPTNYHLDDGTIKFKEWIKHPKLHEYSTTDIFETWKNSFTFKEEISQNGELGLREPQIGAIYSILGHLKSSNELATVVMPTGTGKTETMISVLIANKCQKLLIVVPSDSLRTQLFNKFLICGILKDPRFGVIYQSALNPKVGMLKQTISEVNDLESFFSNCNVVITTMSLINNISSECQEKISELCTHFFIDEAHHAQASSWESFRRRFKNKSIIQFTATPFRNDNQRLEGKIIFNFSLKKAQEQGYFKKINFVPIREYDNLKVDKRIADKAIVILRANISAGYNQILMARCGNQKKAEDVFVGTQRI